MSNLNGRIIIPWLAFEGLPEETFMSKFLSSGFTPATRKQAAAQRLEQAQIVKVDQGVSGQLFVVIKPVPKVRTYELDEAVVNAGVPGTWTTLTLASARKPIPYNGLTPGTKYAFRVRTFGVLGHTDWSDIVTRMCI